MQKTFLNNIAIDTELKDVVFDVVVEAIQAQKQFGKDQVINGTLGSLYNDDHELVTFKSVYDTFSKIDHKDKARYADGVYGNKSYIEAIKQWLFNDKEFDAEVIATPGASGAIALAVKNSLNRSETLLIPDIGWGPYDNIAAEAQVKIARYSMFEENALHIASIEKSMVTLIESQGKVVIIVNDPCHNPTGYTMDDKAWKALTSVLEKVSKLGPVVFVLDIAYLDFSEYRLEYRQRLIDLSKLSPSILSIITFSGSKTLTAYGMRLGAMALLSQETNQRQRFKYACGNSVRGLWSLSNTGAMTLFAKLTFDPLLYGQYVEDIQLNQSLLRKRAQLFIEQAKHVNLVLYPSHEGFFVMIKLIDPVLRNKIFQSLKAKQIFLVNMTGGLRLALSSIPIQQLDGLAKTIQNEILKHQ